MVQKKIDHDVADVWTVCCGLYERHAASPMAKLRGRRLFDGRFDGSRVG